MYVIEDKSAVAEIFAFLRGRIDEEEVLSVGDAAGLVEPSEIAAEAIFGAVRTGEVPYSVSYDTMELARHALYCDPSPELRLLAEVFLLCSWQNDANDVNQDSFPTAVARLISDSIHFGGFIVARAISVLHSIRGIEKFDAQHSGYVAIAVGFLSCHVGAERLRMHEQTLEHELSTADAADWVSICLREREFDGVWRKVTEDALTHWEPVRRMMANVSKARP